MGRSSKVRYPRRSWLALGAALAVVFAGCGGEGPEVPEGTASTGSPEIVAVKALDSGVQVTYRIPGATGGDWPALSIGVQAPGTLLPAQSQDVGSVEEVGTVVVPIKVDPGQELVVSGSALYENGEQIELPEKHVGSPESAAGGSDEDAPAPAANENSIAGSWEARGEVIYVPPRVVSNQPVGSVRERPWSFEEACQAECEIVFTRGTLYGPSVTRLVKRGPFFIADFPPVKVPCSYPRGSSYSRRSFGQSHSRYKLRWANGGTQLQAIEHRFQTGCYRTTDPPDVTRWEATRVP